MTNPAVAAAPAAIKIARLLDSMNLT